MQIVTTSWVYAIKMYIHFIIIIIIIGEESELLNYMYDQLVVNCNWGKSTGVLKLPMILLAQDVLHA